MKTYTITCHKVYNYGASLQAFALQHFLKETGIDNEILNYLPKWMTSDYKLVIDDLFEISDESRYKDIFDKFKIVKLAYAINKLFNFYIRRHRQRGRRNAFDDFDKEYLSVTKIFSSYEELLNEKWKPSDVFITGSDQVWNTRLRNGKDPSFFLKFAPAINKKISYAASFGISQLQDEFVDPIKNYLKDFYWISIREKTGLKILEDLGYSKCDKVLDPVFLLNSNIWRSIEKPIAATLPREYILVYLGGDSSMVEFAKKLSKDTKLPIVGIEDSKRIRYADVSLSDVGPCEFLSLVDNAYYVIAGSFHATAFSLIFNKEFYAFNKESGSSRIRDLLLELSLEERFNTDVLGDKIDWNSVNSIISTSIEACKQKLLYNLK